MWHKPLPPRVDRARQQGWLRPIDVALVQFLQQQEEQRTDDDIALAAAALTSQQLSLGHTCLDLDLLFSAEGDTARTLMGETPRSAQLASAEPHCRDNLATELYQLGYAEVLHALENSGFVGTENEPKPLTLDGHRLYLNSQWSAEKRVAQNLAARIRRAIAKSPVPAQRSELLDTLFTEASQGINWQKIACANALRGHFSLITGGPGTGKTTTVVKLLCALLAQQPERRLNIRMAAPTGKAAARMQESISFALSNPLLAPWRDQLQLKAQTIHRLLGVIPGNREFRHNQRNPLLCDVVIIDEASMIALDQMDSLLRALPDSTHLVLLGDKDQLASVEAGAVMGDLCQGADSGDYQPQQAEWLSTVSGEIIDEDYQNTHGSDRLQRVTLLRHSHRFDANSGIGQLAEAINTGNGEGIDGLFSNHADIGLVDVNEWRGLCRLGNAEIGAIGYANYLQAMRDQRPNDDASQADFDHWAVHLLEQRNRFQLLCALRRGEYGIEAVNAAIEADLHYHGLLAFNNDSDASDARDDSQWYEGRPIMIHKNDYSVGLMNGDTGIVLRKPDGDGLSRLYAVFPDPELGLRWLAPSRLSSVETAFAITVHKSQGSEFEHTALLLPSTDNPVLSRELVYTAVTRAKTRFSLCCRDTQLVQQLSGRPTLRSSGLQQQLEKFLHE